jgi:D-aminopeptidase
VAAGVFAFNGFGRMAGVTQLEELGEPETPILLTNTLAVGRAVKALVDWTLAQPGNEGVLSVNAVVGETNDGRLNDIRARGVTAAHMLAARDAATTGPVAEGGVGAGTGTWAFGWQGGIERTGAAFSDGSGDDAIAFATHPGVIRTPATRAGAATVADWPNDRLSPLFVAAIEAREEAVLNALTMATTIESRIGGKRAVGRALPLDRVAEVVAERRP